jgi:hypothetical protein
VRFFVCSLEGFSLGIPADKTGRVIAAPRSQRALYETENGEAFVSIPALFQKGGLPAPHGIVLKRETAGNGEETSGGGEEGTGGVPGRRVLLVPQIGVDLDIPPGDIKSPPGLIGECLPYFRGVYFTGKDMILLLDPDVLWERVRSVSPRGDSL